MQRLLLPTLAPIFALVLTLAACTLTQRPEGAATAPTATPAALAPGEVAVSALPDAPAAGTSVTAPEATPIATPNQPPQPAATKPPPARHVAPPAPEPATEPAPPPLSPDAAACIAKGGTWSPTGLAKLHTCLTPTRDAGKSCRRASDCEGLCLARSRSCAPIKPLFGCNPILQEDGSEATLCID